VSEANSNTLQQLVRRWEEWPKDELAQELRDRMQHFYGQTDGTMKFPNSVDGDLLRMVHVLLKNNTPATGKEE